MSSPVPELTTFGSILRFAIELEAATSAFYGSAVDVLKKDGLEALARELSAQHASRHRLLERTRQRVNEMVLEPIAGLDGSRYAFDPTPAPGDAVLARALALEEIAGRFYAETSAAARQTLVEASRTFRKLGEESARNAGRLRGLSEI